MATFSEVCMVEPDRNIIASTMSAETARDKCRQRHAPPFGTSVVTVRSRTRQCNAGEEASKTAPQQLGAV